MMSSDNPGDDVDRLFDCFKCGLSTPESALKERKTRQGKLRKVSLKQAATSAHGDFLSTGSTQQRKHKSANMQLCMEKHGTSAVKAIKFNSGKQISPVVFYGSPHGVPAKRPIKLLRLLREIHVDLTEENDLNPRDEVWATFPKQEQAMRFAKAHVKVYVFSYQDHLNGQRRFLVSTYTEFWRRYKNMDPKFRHHYEVIQEGLPCHLYFDLEFSKKVNPEKDGAEMVDILILVILDALFDKYAIKGDQEWIIELDSSTEEKFSRHLIVRIPEMAFKDNSHAGAFVAEICSRISIARESDPRLDKLYALKDSKCPTQTSQLFLDTAVYSRNRCFRLALSSKAGKSSVLLPTGRFKCKNMSQQQMFMESLICRMDADCKKLLICKMDLDCKKTLCFDSEVNSNCEQSSKASQEIAHQACTSNLPGTYLTGKSPFPALDFFVESIASIGNVSGRIRSWYWFSEHGLMVYSMSRNRYCERIGREHKSNHVMYVVDFKRAGYYQKCYDPDCRGYRSPLRPIPNDTIPDNMATFNSTWVENCGEMMNIYFDLQHGENDLECTSPGKDERITESYKKDHGWWLEAIRIADDIENMRKAPNSGELAEEVFAEDCEWWIEVERTTSQIEQQASLTG
ncbi:uncharacterized protein LOC131233321 isoform X2 [Magnolia sinica]|uniref:uncharacterized protein LOC131233321 isoform X2 n=1 Tax=Magnolia sinica TaxID=86752 RepID=UPI00265AEAF8|nr:uncharacterized protein LOC131233321 isoform X2 [Magnolia sinica]